MTCTTPGCRLLARFCDADELHGIRRIEDSCLQNARARAAKVRLARELHRKTTQEE